MHDFLCYWHLDSSRFAEFHLVYKYLLLRDNIYEIFCEHVVFLHSVL